MTSKWKGFKLGNSINIIYIDFFSLVIFICGERL